MSIEKLNMTFVDYQGPNMDANLMNKITSKIDETIDGVNNGGGTGGSSGNEIVIGDESKITEDTKLFIDPDEVLPQGNDVVDSLEGNETNKAPSVRVIKEAITNNLITNGDAIRTNEKIDGKWVYKKRIYFNTLIGAGTTLIPHGITNYDLIWIDYGDSFMISGVMSRGFPLLYYSNASKDSVDAFINGDNIIFIADTSWSTNWTKGIVVKYTLANEEV